MGRFKGRRPCAGRRAPEAARTKPGKEPTSDRGVRARRRGVTGRKLSSEYRLSAALPICGATTAPMARMGCAARGAPGEWPEHSGAGQTGARPQA